MAVFGVADVFARLCGSACQHKIGKSGTLIWNPARSDPRSCFPWFFEKQCCAVVSQRVENHDCLMLHVLTQLNGSSRGVGQHEAPVGQNEALLAKLC